MRTGEGKTLTGVFPAYLGALARRWRPHRHGRDYLAGDSRSMGRVHHFLGLEVGVILADMDPPCAASQYAADITYGTNHANEFGFDYCATTWPWRCSRTCGPARP